MVDSEAEWSVPGLPLCRTMFGASAEDWTLQDFIVRLAVGGSCLWCVFGRSSSRCDEDIDYETYFVRGINNAVQLLQVGSVMYCWECVVYRGARRAGVRASPWRCSCAAMRRSHGVARLTCRSRARAQESSKSHVTSSDGSLAARAFNLPHLLPRASLFAQPHQLFPLHSGRADFLGIMTSTIGIPIKLLNESTVSQVARNKPRRPALCLQEFLAADCHLYRATK